MRNWYDIIPPHEDIQRGNFDEAVFAADLGDVANGTAAPDYRDPYLFFKKTYLTKGLTNLLQQVHRKLSRGEGPSVVEIQTPFGGGKTHALVTIYHYLKHGQRVRELLPDGVEILAPKMAAGIPSEQGCNLSVVAGNHWDPVGGRSSGGVTRRTFWGEIAFQLAGLAGYQEFRRNDEQRISPGKEKLRTFLAGQQPFILLFDEILEYINRALDRRDELSGSLGTQTFSFFQELTEAVSTLPNGMLVVTLPSSHLEDFGEAEEESLARLNKIFGRVQSIETPVEGEEVYAVIRRRLFNVEQLQQRPMREVVHTYYNVYQQNREDLPTRVRDVEYRDKMELAYPFHPEVIDILYEKWSTYPSFQRTRGVLRLLANVVEDLYKRETNIDLILPGDLNLGHAPIRREFLTHAGSEFEGIIGSDIAGHGAKAQELDESNKPWKHLAERIATAIFFHSFSAADEAGRGIDLPTLKLDVLRSETIPALVTEVLGKLDNTLWYLNSRGGAYYFSRIPNLNRMVLQKKEQYNQRYEEELEKIIKREIGTQFNSYLWPRRSDDVPDNRELKLVILHPEDDGSQIPAWIERRGSGFREYKNTLFFALSDTGAFARFREELKTYLALREIKEAVDSGENPQLESKKAEIGRRMHDIQRDFSFNMRRMYRILDVDGQRIDLGQPTAGNESLSHWYWRELTSVDHEKIATQIHYRFLVNRFLQGRDEIPAALVLDQFYKNQALPTPSEAGVVARAIQLGVQDRGLGLAVADNGALDPSTVKYGQPIPLDAVSFDPDVMIVSAQKAEALLAQIQPTILDGGDSGEIAPAADQPSVSGVTGGARTGATGPDPYRSSEGADGPGTTEKQYRRVRLVIDNVSAGRIADVNRGILMPIKSAAGEFSFTLAIDVTCPEGLDQSTLENKIKETIRQIGASLREERVELANRER